MCTPLIHREIDHRTTHSAAAYSAFTSWGKPTTAPAPGPTAEFRTAVGPAPPIIPAAATLHTLHDAASARNSKAANITARLSMGPIKFSVGGPDVYHMTFT